MGSKGTFDGIWERMPGEARFLCATATWISRSSIGLQTSRTDKQVCPWHPEENESQDFEQVCPWHAEEKKF